MLPCTESIFGRRVLVVVGRCEGRLAIDLGVKRLGGGLGAAVTMEALVGVCVACGVGVVVGCVGAVVIVVVVVVVEVVGLR